VKEFEDGRVRQAGPTQKLPSPAVKEVEHFGSYNLKHFEHPNEGSCTARHRARTHSGTSNVHPTLRLCAHLIGIHTGTERCIQDTDAGDGRCV
jgi:hypothetical protein